MPVLGEIETRVTQGENRKNYFKYIWVECPSCHEQRWVRCIEGKPSATRCRKCNTGNLPKCLPAEQCHNWKGGRYKDGYGYITLTISPDDTFYPMANKAHNIPEHRYVMAKHLNRCLLRSEAVHHINGIKDDNRIENLQLVSPSDHSIRTQLCKQCSAQKEVRLLRSQVKLLRAQLREHLV